MNNVVAISTNGANYSAAQIKLIKDTVAKDCNPMEFDLFVTVAQNAGLDPFRKQISAIVFSKTDPEKRRMSIITTIDGLRVIAARSRRYRPDEDEPEYEYDAALKGPDNPVGLVKAVVKIYIADDRKEGGWRPVRGVAYWSEFAALKEEVEGGFDWVDTGETWPDTGKPKKRKVPRNEGAKAVPTADGNWAKMPRVMLAKCFDSQTEVLTASGFQRFSEVSAPIMQVTPGGLEPVSATPFAQPYDGAMVVLDSDDLNFCVTPNHDMVTTAGKIEAGALYEAARSRPTHFIPRIAPARPIDADISDGAIRLAAAYLADGSDSSASGFRIAVSRPRKVAALRELALHHAEAVKRDGGRVADAGDRQITTTADKASFSYKFEATGGLVFEGKAVDTSLLASFSQRQARLFVDALVEFDGHASATGVRRFYASRPQLMGAFEMAAVIGGYSVSNRKTRRSDLGAKPNLYVTISDRDAIPVVRRGDGGTGLAQEPNQGGEVWCVTVPSGEIVVRRNGFSFRCGNCAEAQALRKAFPEDLSGLYEGAELDRAQAAELSPSEMIGQFDTESRLAKIGANNGITFQLFPNGPLESIALGQIADRVMETVSGFGAMEQIRWFESANTHPLREFWARSPTDGLALKKHLEAKRAQLERAAASEGAE